MKHRDRVILKRLLRKHVPTGSRILDVGCGVGTNLSLLKDSGYAQVVGVDISPEMAAKSKAGGFEAYDLASFAASCRARFNVILFSHVLEHIEYRDLQPAMEGYFRMLDGNAGAAIILGPTLHSRFFSNVDHVRPYHPKGLTNLFSNKDMSRQYSSEWRMSLKDIYFRREPLRIDYMRARFLKDPGSRLVARTLDGLCSAMAIATLGLAAQTTGFGAFYKVWKEGPGAAAPTESGPEDS